MPTIEIRVPQLGEGLQEARVVRLLKQPGDQIRRDEPIYEMETDKAVMEVESPFEGVLEAWAANEDDILPIGAVVAKIATGDDIPVAAIASVAVGEPVAAENAQTIARGEQAGEVQERSDLRNANIPPRTRAYAKEKGLHEQELLGIHAASGKLLPADIDRYLATRNAGAAAATSDTNYEDIPMSARQRTLSYRLARTVQQVVPGTIEIPVNWEPVEKVSQHFKDQNIPEDKRPSSFLLMAWCVAQAIKENSKFRSVIVGDNIVRQFHAGNLGIAVALPDDELVTALVPSADSLNFEQFIQTARQRIAQAREGKDQASEGVIHVSLTNMAAFGLRTAVPVVVPPSIATVFLGAPYNAVESDGKGGIKLQRVAHIVMTFDHRLINGVGAANFINQIAKNIQKLPEQFGVQVTV